MGEKTECKSNTLEMYSLEEAKQLHLSEYRLNIIIRPAKKIDSDNLLDYLVFDNPNLWIGKGV